MLGSYFYTSSHLLSSHYDPSSYKDASYNPFWQQVMSEELQALEKA